MIYTGTVFNKEDAQSPAMAAVDVFWLATLPAGGAQPYGELVQKRRVLTYGDE